MKRIGKMLSAAMAVTALLSMTGCDTIRDYSVNSYQGVLPMGDFRPTASIPTTVTSDSPKSAVPAPAPAAGASGSTTATK